MRQDQQLSQSNSLPGVKPWAQIGSFQAELYSRLFAFESLIQEHGELFALALNPLLEGA